MEKSEIMKAIDERIVTDILRSIYIYGETIKMCSNTLKYSKLFEVFDSLGQITYVISKNIQKKFGDGRALIERITRKIEASKVLNQYTENIGKIINIKTYEHFIEEKHCTYIVTEEIIKCGGCNLMKCRSQLNALELLDVIFQSAVTIATAHSQGIYHGNINPMNILLEKSKLTMINFELGTKADFENYVFQISLAPISNSDQILPDYDLPELNLKNATKKNSLLIAEKIDVYCWGMSMYQFLLDLTNDEFKNEISTQRYNHNTYSIMLNKIRNQKIPELESDIAYSLMKLISKCVKFSPQTRINMNEVLECIIGNNKKYKNICSVLPAETKQNYYNKIREINCLLIRIPNSCDLSIEKEYKSKTKFIHPFLQKTFVQLCQFVKKPEVIQNTVYKKYSSSSRYMDAFDDIKTNSIYAAAGLLKDPRNSKEVTFSSNRTDEKGIEYAITALSANNDITTVKLLQYHIGKMGSKFISAWIYSSIKLVLLEMNGNMIGNEGAKLISSALKHNSSITKICLEYNSINDLGAKYVSNALLTNRRVEYLSFRFNFIGDEGAKYLLKAIMVNPILKTLNLYRNWVGAKGADFFAISLLVNPRIYIDSGGNSKFYETIRKEIQRID